MDDEALLEHMTATWRSDRTAVALTWLFRHYVRRLGEGSDAAPVLQRLGTPSSQSAGSYWFESEDAGSGVASLYLEVDGAGRVSGLKMP